MNAVLFFVTVLASFLWAGPEALASVEYQGSKHRDPFQISAASPETSAAGSEQKTETSQWRLEGLIWNSDSPQAIVNGNILREGSRLGDAEVTHIDHEGIILKLQGKEVLLRQTRKDVP